MILSVDNGCFSYKRGGKEVLKNVSFSAAPGDVVAILGANGAGKTTLLRCILGFLKWSSGGSFLDGKNMKEIPHRALWRTVAYVPQAKGTASATTVLEFVLLGRGSHIGTFAKPSATDLAYADASLSRLRIGHLAQKRCTELSGGELQMTLIARALAAQPQILVLDEPESNLDFKNQLLVLEAVSSLAAEGMTCVFNTHFPAHALQRANKALLLSADGGSRFGGADAIITEENIRNAFGVQVAIGQMQAEGKTVPDVVPVEICEF